MSAAFYVPQFSDTQDKNDDARVQCLTQICVNALGMKGHVKHEGEEAPAVQGNPSKWILVATSHA